MEWFQTASLMSITAILCGGYTVFWLERNPVIYGTCGYGTSNVAAVLAVVTFIAGFTGLFVSLIAALTAFFQWLF